MRGYGKRSRDERQRDSFDRALFADTEPARYYSPISS
jgi:hypothetical protein